MSSLTSEKSQLEITIKDLQGKLLIAEAKQTIIDEYQNKINEVK